MNQCQRLIGLVVLITALTTSPCLALQSGSRGGGATGSFGSQAPIPSVGGSGSRVIAPPLNSHAFSPPSIGTTFAQPNSQIVQPSGPVVSGFQGTPQFQGQPIYQGRIIQQPTFQQNDLQMFNQIAAPPSSHLQGSPNGGSGRSAVGIPDSSLVNPVFEQSNPGSAIVINHSTWDAFLARYLVTDAAGINRLRYGQVSQQDRYNLKGYLQSLQSVDTRTLNRSEQLAYWFNLYNAKTADTVLDNYPIRSIRQIKTKFTDFVGPFDDPGAVTVLGIKLSLNDIESGVVRPVFRDPRIHYALNCASFGCPNLSPSAWTSNNLDARLNNAAYQYINSGRAVQKGLRGVRVSKIFKWYKDDFGGNDQAVINHLKQYSNEQTLQKLRGRGKIAGYFYDWSLNDGKILRRRILEPVIR